jgi:hypothetical protein
MVPNEPSSFGLNVLIMREMLGGKRTFAAPGKTTNKNEGDHFRAAERSGVRQTA